MSDFSDRPLVAGSLTGLRAFSADKYGRLVGPSQRVVFRPGENRAECRSSKYLVSGIPAGSTLTAESSGYALGAAYYTVTLSDGAAQVYHSAEDVAREYPPRDMDHQLGGLSCGCGFYAYFDGRNDYLSRGDGNVAALIEGYGVCTVGDRGFRAEKARLLAFIEPEHLRDKSHDVEPTAAPSRWQQIKKEVSASRFLFALASVNAATAVGSAFVGAWVQVGVSSIWSVSMVAQGAIAERERRREVKDQSKGNTLRSYYLTYRLPGEPDRREISRALWERLLSNYPDVPVYGTQEAALAAHPLTRPADPTPEDPEFWTRSAS